MYPEYPLTTWFKSVCPSLAMALLKGMELTDSAALYEQLDKVLNLRTWITKDTYRSMLSLHVEETHIRHTTRYHSLG